MISIQQRVARVRGADVYTAAMAHQMMKKYLRGEAMDQMVNM